MKERLAIRRHDCDNIDKPTAACLEVNLSPIEEGSDGTGNGGTVSALRGEVVRVQPGKICPVEHRQMSKGKNQTVTFDQFSLSGDFPPSEGATAPNGEVRWNHKWDAPAFLPMAAGR